MAPPPQLPVTTVVQPWEDLPEVQELPVRTQEPRDEVPNMPVARMEPAQSAHQLVAVPVRNQPESSSDMAATQAASLEPTPEGDFWFATVQALIESEAIAAMVRELALQAQLVARDSDQWLLRVERESLNQPSTKERLANALRAAGHGIALAVEVGRVQDNPARRIRAAQEARQQGAEKIILEDPLVQALVQNFGAKIVPGSIKPL